MADIATLGIVVNYRDDKDAQKKLDAIAVSAGTAEKAVEKLNTSSKKASDGLKSHSSATEKASKSYLQYVSEMKKLTTSFDSISGTQKGLKDLQKNLAAIDKEAKKAYESGKMHLDGYNKLGAASDSLTKRIKEQSSALKDQTGGMTAYNRLAAESKVIIGNQTKAKEAQIAMTKKHSEALVMNAQIDQRAAESQIKMAKQHSQAIEMNNKIDQNARNAQIAMVRKHSEAIQMNNRIDQKAAQDAQRAMQASMKTNKSFLGSIMDLRSAWVTYSLAIGAVVYTIKSVSQAIFDAGQKTIIANNTYKAITGSAQAANVEFQYLRKTAEDLGLNFYTLRDGYKGFLAAAQSSKIPMDEVRKIFTSVSNAGAVLGLSNERMSLTFLALEQMLSKGKVSMEEIRRQMGDNLPGAFQIGAKAMGMTVEAFDKAVSAGEIYSDEFLPKFRLALDEAFKGSVPESAKALNKLAEAWEDAKNKMADGAFMDSIVKAMKSITDMLKDPEFLRGMADAAMVLGKLLEYSAKATAKAGAIGGGIEVRSETARLMNSGLFNPDEFKAGDWTVDRLREANRYYRQIEELAASATQKITENSKTATSDITKYMGVSIVELEALIKTTEAKIKSFDEGPTGKGSFRFGEDADEAKRLNAEIDTYKSKIEELKAIYETSLPQDSWLRTGEFALKATADYAVTAMDNLRATNRSVEEQRKANKALADSMLEAYKKDDTQKLQGLQNALKYEKEFGEARVEVIEQITKEIAEIRKKDADKAAAEAKKAAAPIEAQLQEMAKAQELLDSYKRKGNKLSEKELEIMAKLEVMLRERESLEERYRKLTGQRSKTEISDLEAVQKELKDQTAIEKELLEVETKREKLRKEATARFRETAQFMSDVLKDEVEVGEDAAAMLEKIYSSQIPITKELQADIAELNRLKAEGIKLALDQQLVNGKTDYDDLVAQKKIIESAKEHIKAIEKAQKAYDDFSDTIKDNIKDIIKSHENMAEKIISIFEDMLYEIMATIIAQKIVVPIGIQLGSALGASWNGTPFAAMTGGSNILNTVSSANSLYNAFNGGVSNFLGAEGLGGKVGSSIFGLDTWFGTGMSAGSSIAGAGAGALPFYGGAEFMVPGVAGAAGSGGLAAGLAAAAPYAAIAAIAIPLLIDAFKDEPDPRLGVYWGQWAKDAPGATPSSENYWYHTGSQDGGGGAVENVVIKYMDARLKIVDDAIGGALNDAMKATPEWGSDVWLDPTLYGGDVQAMMNALENGLFRELKDSLVDTVLGADFTGILGDDFFAKIAVDGEKAFDTFSRFATVIDKTENGVDSFTRQLGLTGDAVKAFGNMETIYGVFAGINALVDPLIKLNDPLVQIVDQFNAWVDVLEDSKATLEDVTKAQEKMNTALGLQITGLTATNVGNSISGAIMGQTDIDTALNTIIGQAIAGNLATALTEDVMNTAILPFVDSIGAAFIGSGSNMTAFMEQLPALMATLDLDSSSEQISAFAQGWKELFGDNGSLANEDALRSQRLALYADIAEMYDNESNAVTILAEQRKIELAAMDESIRPLQQIAWSLEDATAAAEKEMDIHKTRLGLYAEYAELTGNTAAAERILNEQRRLELKELDPVTAKIQEAVWAVQDQIKAEEDLIDTRKRAQESIQNLIDNLMGGSLAPVQSMEFFNRRYDQMLNEAIGAEGTEAYGEKVSNLTGFIPNMLEFAQAYGGDYKGVFDAIMDDLKYLGGGVPQFESGGFHDGGLAIVHGQELISSGPATISNKNETIKMISDAVQGAVGNSGESNINLTVNLKVGTHEFRALVMETIKVDPETQKQVRRVANG